MAQNGSSAPKAAAQAATGCGSEVTASQVNRLWQSFQAQGLVEAFRLSVYPECGPGYPLHQVRQSGLTVFIIQGALEAQIAPVLEPGENLVASALYFVYDYPALFDKFLSTKERDTLICARHAAGISQAELARQFGSSYQRVHQIVHAESSR